MLPYIFLLLLGLRWYVSTDRTDELVLHLVPDVDEVVRSSRMLRLLLVDFLFVLDFGDVAVVVLAPDFAREVVNVDPVVPKRRRACIWESVFEGARKAVSPNSTVGRKDIPR